MNNNNGIKGIHHITAIAGSAEENVAFYQEVLGLRLVKQTVNFDDPSTYHLYYGDREGNPGTIMTFFPWQETARGKNGAGMVTAVAFEIAKGCKEYWKKKLLSNNVATRTEQRFGEEVIKFTDPSGMELELIAARETVEPSQNGTGGIVHKSAIVGFHSATATLQSIENTKNLLVDILGMKLDDQEGNRYRFRMNSKTSPGIFYDLVIDSSAEQGKQGSGSVHHIAFRTPDDKKQLAWQSTLRKGGYRVTDVTDRKYFKSIYFHEPGGVLFEIATDPPGFTVDESIMHFGESLQLPAVYEPMRPMIERRLPPLWSKYIHP
ncbi:MAG: ring-cleaving dioxygenase [Desulforhopalus sp.]